MSIADAIAAPSPRKIAIGVALISAANILRLAIQLLMFPVLARLLSPADYGIMALAVPITMFALTIADGGMGPALLRTADPDGNVEATMFWTAVGASLTLVAVMIVAANPIAEAMSHAGVATVLVWLAPILVLNALCAVPSVRNQRRGATWVFALGDISSTIAGVGVALYGALNGWSVWSLVAQQLVLWVVKVIVLTGSVKLRVPGMPSRAAFVYLMSNGMPLVGANLLTLFSASIDNILIGRLLGVEQLGLYALAYQIVRIPESVLVGPILVTFLPAIARLADDRAQAASLFLGTLRMMFGLAAPLMLGLALVSDLAVMLLLGPRWQEATILLRLLAPAAIAQAMGFVAMALLLGRGRSVLQFRLALLNAGGIFAGALAGSASGLVGVAFGVALAACFGNTVYVVAAMREIGLGSRDLLRGLMPAIVATAAMVIGVGGLRMLLPPDMSPLVAMFLAVSTGTCLFALTLQLISPATLAAYLVPFRRANGRPSS
ncbi:MAG: lipopolysaccharide biosynthesis protein [Acetobacteraceae bacterium]|nr:lipopolysaccharide biosynthesis protein [Acetobacteraceae bacterium]